MVWMMGRRGKQGNGGAQWSEKTDGDGEGGREGVGEFGVKVGARTRGKGGWGGLLDGARWRRGVEDIKLSRCCTSEVFLRMGTVLIVPLI